MIMEKLKIFASILLVNIILWIGITTMIQRFKCEDMGKKELTLRTFKSANLNFKNCN